MKAATLSFFALSLILMGCNKGPRFQKATIEVHEPNPFDELEPALHFGKFVAQDQTLFDLIAYAYQVEPAQIIGADNLRENGFNVFADLPPGATAEQLPAMLRSLLEDRFKIKSHRESKTQAVFLLTVAPAGPKFREAPEDPNFEPVKPTGYQYAIPLRNKMSRWAQVLSQFVKKPVLDRTNLKGKYSADLGINMDGDPIAVASRELPDQLGLHLDPQVETLQMLVIDKAEPLPTPNGDAKP
jgi:uncharacterized protein (TIGR03435 family)